MAKKLKTTTQKLTIADAVSSAFSDLQELGEEMREAFDNTPESLQQGDVGQRREAAADALESISEVDVPEKFADVEIEVSLISDRKMSRPKRRDNAVAMLQAVTGYLEGLDEDDEADSFCSDLDNAIAEADDVDFPGMFG